MRSYQSAARDGMYRTGAVLCLLALLGSAPAFPAPASPGSDHPSSECPPQFASCLSEKEVRHNLELLAELENLRTQVKILKGGSFLKRHFSLGAAAGPTAVFCSDVGSGSACVGVTVGITIH